MKIYVVGSSKNKFLPLDDIREKFLIDEKHEGDNIDFLNPWYCELTGLYYLWKHVDDDIVGLEHYRRYFVNEKGNLLSENEIRDILKNHDVIGFYDKTYIPKNAGFFKQQNKIKLSKFCAIITVKNEKLGKIIHDYVLAPGSYMCNMIICKKTIFDKICEQLFELLNDADILDEIKRSHGYLSEMVLGALFKYNNFKVYNSGIRFIK